MSYISREGAKRTKAVVEQVEAAYVNDPIRGRKPSASNGVCLVHAKTGGSGLGAASSVTQMTSATVRIWIPDRTGALTDSGIDVTFWNKETGGAVSANTHIVMALGPCGYVCLWEVGAC